MLEILEKFPNSRDGLCEERSPKTRLYNCIAFAMEDRERNWWPKRPCYWPRGVRAESSIAAFAALFTSYGYHRCPSPDLEPGYAKIALYARGVRPTHAARQLSSGNWASKIGGLEDIEHTLEVLEGEKYGRVVRIFRKRIAD